MRCDAVVSLCGGLAIAGLLGLVGSAGAAVPAYSLVGSYDAPAGAFDLLPDGRLLSVGTDGVVRRQASLHAGTYDVAGSVDLPINQFGASFARVSPDGSTLAIGDGNFGAGARVGFVGIGDLTTAGVSATTSAIVGNFDAHWSDGQTLLVTGSDNDTFAPDVFSVDAASLGVTTLITQTGGASGGITSDGTHVYVADGFNTADGGAPTGNIRAFAIADLGGTPVPFADGTLVADALSGSSLGFDSGGNLLVGGGDFFAGSGDFGYGAVIDGDAIAGAIAGGPFAPDSAELRLSPAGDVGYTTLFNSATDELLVIGAGTVFRYAVPAPGTGAAVLITGVLLGVRRRRA